MQKQAGLSKVPTRTLPSYRETPYFHCTNTLQVRPPARRPASPDPGCPRSENRDSSARMISSRSIASISPSQVLSLRESCNRGCRCRGNGTPGSAWRKAVGHGNGIMRVKCRQEECRSDRGSRPSLQARSGSGYECSRASQGGTGKPGRPLLQANQGKVAVRAGGRPG